MKCKKKLSILLIVSILFGLLPNSMLQGNVLAADLPMLVGTPIGVTTEGAIAVEQESDEGFNPDRLPREAMITTPGQLSLMTDGNYTLVNDIELSDWTPIDFSGTLDGNGHTITLNGKPLFNNLNGTVKNLLLEGSVTAPKNVGALAYTMSGGLIQNCWSGVSVKATGYMPDGVAGFVGNMTGGKAEGCVVTGTLTKSSFGKFYGIAVKGYGATFGDCYWTTDTLEVAQRRQEQTCERITEAQYADIIALLNSTVGATEGLRCWEIDSDGIPKPIGQVSDGSTSIIVDKTKLKEVLDKAAAYEGREDEYLEYRWDTFQKKLATAQEVYNNPAARQAAIDSALDELTIAIGQLITKENYNKLNKKTEEASALDYEEYTLESWQVVTKALSEANNILWEATTIKNSKGTTNAHLSSAYEELSKAIEELKHIEWTEIDSADVLARLHGDGNYKLTVDITQYKGNPNTFTGKLDGNGHTVTFAKGAKPLFHTIDKDAQVRNIGLVGEVNGGGAFAEVLNGKVFNSYSWANVNNGNNPAGGIAGKLSQTSDALVKNTYVKGTIEGSMVGAIIGEAGQKGYLWVENSYWVNGQKVVGNDEEDRFKGGAQKSLKEMQDKAFCQSLNINVENTGTKWKRNEEGLPYFGEEAAPQEKAYPVVMTDLVDGSKQVIEYKDETLTTDIFGEPSGYIAQLALQGYEGDVYWKTTSTETNSPIMVAASSGKIFVRGPGTVKVTAHKEWSEGEILQSFYITTEVSKQFDLMLKVGDKDYTNGHYAANGSEGFSILPYVKVGDDGAYTQVSEGLFRWESDTPSTINVGTDGWVTIKKVGSANISVSLGNVSQSIKITAGYIGVTGIESNFEGEYIIHGRNPNSIGQNDTPGVASFNPLRNVDQNGDVIVGSEFHMASVLPENATYASQYVVTSTNKDVLTYKGELQNCLLPLKAGKTFVTVASKDPQLQQQVSDTAVVTIKYLNPLTGLKVKEPNLTVKAGETIDAGLMFEGENSAPSTKYPQGLHVTESNMIWTQTSTDGGQVSAYRSYPVIMIGDQNYFKNEGAVSNDQWLIRGVKPGTVTLTGIPVDDTYDVEPITLQITVSEGDIVDKPAPEQVSEQLNQTASYYIQQMKTPTFGSEWGILGLARVGYLVSKDVYETYYGSVYKKVTEEANKSKDRWENKVTETQRLALAMTAIGKDPTNVNGVNLLNYSWNKQAYFPNSYDIGELGDRQGSNELIFGLLAVEAHNSFKQPNNATITVDGMVHKLLEKFQLADGGFGLYDNKTLSVDLTAMAIQALAKHQDEPHVKEAIDKAFTKLSRIQGIDGSYGNAEATSQVILALTEMGIDPDTDPRFIKDGLSLVDGLMKYANKEGSFSHTIGGGANPIATEQALYTLVGLNRFYENKSSLYNMNDVSFGGESTDDKVTGVKIIGSDTTLTIGEKTTLSAQVLPAHAKNQNVIWSSSNKEVATVSQEGVVKAISKGKTTIQVMTEEGHFTDEVTIEVADFEVKGYVTLSIDKLAINKGYVLTPTQVEIKEGDTVWDVLKRELDANNIPYRYSYYDQYDSVYVESIDGDGEFDHGAGSGWKYNVDGIYPDYGASQYKLQGGERIQWRYTTNLGADLDEAPLLPGGGPDGAITLEPEIEVDEKGNAHVIISDEAILNALEQAEEAKNNIILIRPIIKGESHTVSIQMQTNGLGEIVKAQKNLKVQTEVASMTLEASGLKQLASQKDKQVAILFKTLDSGAIELEIQVDGKKLSTIEGGIKAEVTAKDTYNKVLVQIEKDGQKLLKKTALTKKGLAVRLEGSSCIQVTTHENTFEDINDEHWAHDAISFVLARELFNGTEENTFSPNESMTRAMLVTVIYRLEDELAAKGTNEFTDVAEDAWYTEAICWATQEGMLEGDQGKFSPHESITREQLAKVLYHYATYLDLDTSVEGNLELFKDKEEISKWSEEALAWAVGTGLIEGREEKILAPNDRVTRAEVATILMDMVILMNE